MLARFRREAQAAGRLNHPNIVSIYDFGEDDGVWYIAMEFVKGRELKDYFEANERFRTADIVRIMTQILARARLLAPAGRRPPRRQAGEHLPARATASVKVADFGIAHIESSNLTQVGTVLGTPAYMSPEQILGLPVDGRSDLFSAGVILYQFLTGERPFAGSATTTMQKVLKEDPLPPSSLNVQVLPAMDAVVRKALAKHADERFQTAQEFADAIRGRRPGRGHRGRERDDARTPGQHRRDRHRDPRGHREPRRREWRREPAARRRRPPPAPPPGPSRIACERDRGRCGRGRPRRRRVARMAAFWDRSDAYGAGAARRHPPRCASPTPPQPPKRAGPPRRPQPRQRS